MRLGTLTLGLLLLASPLAQAYDEDTHFYATYAMARFAGIRDSVATKIALCAQWMDESYISDPTSLLVLPITGVKKRRLLHFPSSRVEGKLAAYNQDDGFGFKEFTGVSALVVQEFIKYVDYQGDLAAVVAHTVTEPNHEFASILLMEGLKEGNLMKASASLHVLEDSFAHAGTAAEEGHTMLWHWPDRPFDDLTKYLQMTEVLFKALVAIREQLPAEALDCNMKLGSLEANCALSAEALAALYDTRTDVVSTVSADVLKDHHYIRPVLVDFINRGLAAHYLIPPAQGTQIFFTLLDQTLVQNALVSLDTYAMLERYVLLLARQGSLLNLEQIPRNMGLITDPTVDFADYLKSFAKLDAPDADPSGVQPFIHEMVRRVLSGYVPVPLSDIHREEFEDDKALPRKTEMDIRVANMQRLIEGMFGTHIEFVANNSKDDIGFTQEVLLENSAQSGLDGDKTRVTFSLAEKNAWDHLIFHYLFPNLPPEVLQKLANVMVEINHASLTTLQDTYAQYRQSVDHSNSWGITKTAKDWASYPLEFKDYLLNSGAVVHNFASLKPFARTYFSDTVNTHIQPSGDEKFYQNAELFAQFKARKADLFPKFFGANDVWSLDSQQGVRFK